MLAGRLTLQPGQLAPDVVLMDIRMPGTDGVQATRAIIRDRVSGDRPHVLVVTTFDLDYYVYQALKVGASGFLMKDEAPESLAAAVRTVAAGDALLAPVLLRRLLDEYVSRPEPGHVSPPPELTEREVKVLQLIGRGRSNSEIANRPAPAALRARDRRAASGEIPDQWRSSLQRVRICFRARLAAHRYRRAAASPQVATS